MVRPLREDLQTGTVTLLFTDVEGSTKLLHELGDDRYAQALAAHNAAAARSSEVSAWPRRRTASSAQITPAAPT
jgi:class 3 adenylate cyclase